MSNGIAGKDTERWHSPFPDLSATGGPCMCVYVVVESSGETKMAKKPPNSAIPYSTQRDYWTVTTAESKSMCIIALSHTRGPSTYANQGCHQSTRQLDLFLFLGVVLVGMAGVSWLKAASVKIYNYYGSPPSGSRQGPINADNRSVCLV
jgi:hypothetical protein